MITPIPKKLLPHTATLMKTAARDAWGKEIHDVYTLRYVRIEPVQAMTYSLSGDMPQVRARLYIDCVNSDTEGAEVEAGDRIVWQGKEYRVVQAADYYEKQTLHHKEVTLA